MRIIGNVKDSKSLANNERLAEEKRRKLEYERSKTQAVPPASEEPAKENEGGSEEAEAETEKPKKARSKKEVQ